MGDGDNLAGVCAQCPVPRVVGERGAGDSQVVDQFRGLGWSRDPLSLAPGIPVASEQDRQGRQVAQDLVLANIDVLRPARIGPGGAGVAVPASVGGPAAGPG
jgi:hypothetical protein